MLDWIQIFLLVYLIERNMVIRSRYKLAIDTHGQFKKEGYWSIWIYHKEPQEEFYGRYGGKMLMYFTNYIVPHFGDKRNKK